MDESERRAAIQKAREAAQHLCDAISEVPRTESEKRVGPYAPVGQASWRASDLLRYLNEEVR